jgi:hypothetical protein
MNPSSPNQPNNQGVPQGSNQPYQTGGYQPAPQPASPGPGFEQASGIPPEPAGPYARPGGAADRAPQPQPQQPHNPAEPAPLSGAMPPPAPLRAAPKASNPNSTQNTLQIAEIRDGIVIMNDGTYRAVVMAKAINFDLMSQSEQEAVEYSYQGFLNSLYFPVQIFIHSQLIDLKPYIAKLDRLRAEHDNMLLAMLIDDYVNYIDALSQQANIMDKEFYIIIPFFPHEDPKKKIKQSTNFFTGLVGLFDTKEQHVVINEVDLENAKDELRNRVQAVLSGLLQCGVQGLPLDTQELIELYYNIYNPDTATYQQLKGFDNMTADVITKGDGQAPQAHLQGELQQ